MTREHPIEPELTLPPPRTVRYRDGFRAGCGTWAGRLILFPHALAGVFILVLAVALTVQYVRVLAFGVECGGRVVKKTATKGGKGWHYDIAYVYPVDGVEHTAHVTVNHDAYEELAEGDPIAVRALESDPERGQWVRVSGHSAPRDAFLPWVMAVFWNGIMCVFLWPALGRPWRHRRLVRIGEPTAGVIQEVSRLNTRPASWKVWYEYMAPDSDGLEPLPRGTWMVIQKATSLSPGTPVTVLYDPAKPTRSVVYELTAYRAV